MRCFPFVAPEGYWKGDTKSRVTPYGATPGSGHTTVASCTTWLDLGLTRPAISAPPATKRVRARARARISQVHFIVLLSLRAIYKKYLLGSYSEFISDRDETLFARC